MHNSLEKLDYVKNKVNEIVNQKKLKITPTIIVITKKFAVNKIYPLIENGHEHFGENQIQESENKWIEIKNKNPNIKLHFVGKLQSNKAEKAVKLFDYIHSLDNVKLASKINQYEKELNKKVKLFIQVNIGKEIQKSGIALGELNNFYDYCTKELSLNIIGLMCLPPINSNSQDYFNTLNNVAQTLNLKDLSMGMSSDYEEAIKSGSTYLRLGTSIMGERVFKE